MSNKTSIALCISVNHTLPGAFLKHFMNFFQYNQEKFDLYPMIEVHYITDYARNMMIKKLLNYKKIPDYFFFIDSDMVFAYDTLEKLVNANKDVITGLYFQKHKPHYPLIWKIRSFKINNNKIKKKYVWHTEFKANQIEEIDACGAGALLVKSSVFKKVGSPWFQFKIDSNACPVGEDIYFCKKLQNNGFKLYSHNGTFIDHIGNAVIGLKDFSLFKENKEYEVEKETGLHPNSFKTTNFNI